VRHGHVVLGSLALVACVAAIDAAATAALARPLRFAPAHSYVVGKNPTAVALGDFNGDGALDIAAADYTSNDVTVLFGDGAGHFVASSVTLATGVGPKAIVAGHFNGDANLDLATANDGSNSVSVLLGNGDGTFAPVANIATDGQPKGLAIGDFNDDDDADLVVADELTDDVSVLLGDGSGGFAAPVNYPTGIRARAVAVGDFNEDGNQDLAVANEGSTSNVTLLFGAGDGTFGTKSSLLAGTSPKSVAVGDLNEDGHQDLVVANETSGDVSVLLGDGSGGFAPAVDYPVGMQPKMAVVADLNGDNEPDLVVGNNDASSVSVLLADIWAPTGTTVVGADGRWHNSPFDVTIVPGVDAISGVAGTQYSIDGVPWVDGLLIPLPAPADHSFDGAHIVGYRSIDGAGNVAPEQTFVARIDTSRPRTLAPWPVTVKRGRTAVLTYRVNDDVRGDSHAAVTVRVRTLSGHLVKLLRAYDKPANTRLTIAFRCTLPRGRYRFSVHATDLAGNTQDRIGINWLTVR
jgi:FG-GAP-like repeat